MTASFFVADWLWNGRWRPDGVVRVESGRARPATDAEVSAAQTVGHLAGSVMPGLTDFHVHLDLVDIEAVATGSLARVLDLGSNPTRDLIAGDVEVVRAGQILTAVGGYPSTRPWAADLFHEVGEGDIDAAITNQVQLGAQVIKVALNSDAGSVWGDQLLEAIVHSAHEAGRHVIAHAEGAGQAARALDAGVDALAHTPWTEVLDDELLSRMAASMSWISTLRIHSGSDRDTALDNLTRFAARGGRILYGTDMGNGPSSGGVEADEIAGLAAAGLTVDQIHNSLSDGLWLPRWTGALARAADAPVLDVHHLADWLADTTQFNVAAWSGT